MEKGMNLLSENEYSFSNTYFWNVILHHHINAFDREKDENFDWMWDEIYSAKSIDKKAYTEYCRKLYQWDLETPGSEGEIEDPKTLILPVGSDISLTMEFHPCGTYYFLNDIMIGEVSGCFHLKYLTYPELMRIAELEYGDVLFHLLLPVSAIREQEKEKVLGEIVRRLQQVPLFREHSEYIGKCVLYGLLVPDSDILDIAEIGTICISNHSFRNALRYDEDKEQIKELNILLSKI